MRNYLVFCAAAAVVAGASSFVFADATAILAPGDPIRAFDHDLATTSSSYPIPNETPQRAIDGLTSTKYLNFGRGGSGFIVIPDAASIVQSFQLTTANDASGRDPATFKLFGTNDAIVSADNSNGLAESWNLISEGSLTLPPPNSFQTPYDPVSFANSTSYSAYKLFFPTTRNVGDIMQFSEVQFFSELAAGGTPILAPTNNIRAIDDPGGSQSAYPIPNEIPANAIDRKFTNPATGGDHTKYLNFGRENSGLIVTPASGSSIIDGIQFTTANDAIERDPVLIDIFGTNDPITSPDNGFGNNENWTLIADNLAYASPLERFTPGPIAIFENLASFASYKIVVVDNRGPDTGNGNSIQFAEVQLYSGAVPEPSTALMVLAGVVGVALKRRRD